VTLTCAARKGALPHEGSGWQSSSEMVKFVARPKAWLRVGWSMWPPRGVTPSAFTVQTELQPPAGTTFQLRPYG